MTEQPMSEERLAEIEGEHARPTRSAYDNHDQLSTLANAIPELIAEVRRLRARCDKWFHECSTVRGERDEALARVAELEGLGGQVE